ncbi:hypothetical protein D3C77_558090 [compost metagenome]
MRAIDAPGRNNLLDTTRHEVDQRRLQAAQQVARRRHDHMLELAAVLHGLQGVRKIFQDQDDGRAAVLQLAFKFVGRVQRVHVHDDQPRAQRAQHAHQIGRHIGHHQRNPGALLKAQALQPSGKRARMPIQLRIGDIAAHRRAGDAGGVLLAGPVQQVRQRGIALGGDLCRHPLRIVSKPRSRHGVCLH